VTFDAEIKITTFLTFFNDEYLRNENEMSVCHVRAFYPDD